MDLAAETITGDLSKSMEGTMTVTKGNSSNLMEARYPMEESSAVASAFPIKRKAESDPAVESEESDYEIEESGDEIEESSNNYVESINAYFKSKWIEPEWDVDSFDGLEYESSQEENKFTNEEDERDWRRFKRQHIENKGFYVDPELWRMYKYTKYIPVGVSDFEMYAGRGQTYGEFFTEKACLCLQKYNQENKSKDESFINVEFVELVRAIYTANNKPKSFVTFMAREKPDGPLVEYQAKLWCTVVQHENYPILCRPAPPLKT